MSDILEHLSSLRREITDLRSRNTRYSQKSDHSLIEKSAFELRTIRLQQIKYELTALLNGGSSNSAVWWEKLRKTDHAA